MACRVRFMAKEDIPQVTVIDREAFPTMWPPVNFQHELTNRLARYIVVCDSRKTSPENIETRQEVPHSQPGFFSGFKRLFGSRPKSEVVLAPAPPEFVVGFVGMWIMVDEAHIINIAVRETCRGNGIGELLLISSIDLAAKLGARVVTLEVRVSNTIARNLYLKYGFKEVGVRKGYYTDNREDAIIMTTDFINSDDFRKHFLKLKNNLFQKLKEVDYRILS